MEPGNDLEETKQRLIEWNKKPENRLILVQATISESHPVNASGILDVLEKLGLKEAVKAHPERVALVFIVPEPKLASYKRQEIRPERHGSLTCVKHIGRHTEKALHKRGIFSINQLLEAVANDSSVVLNKVRNSLSNLRGESYSDAMTKIPQFVCCLPRSETTKLDKLEELGFMDRKLNSVVLEQHGGDLPLVVKILTRRSVEKLHRKADH
ncbi:hypothetical protein DVH05_028503 [Phytophthora capsici]|nr:hypothetical protein DVH05_028503 [Phytophthora capsici]